VKGDVGVPSKGGFGSSAKGDVGVPSPSASGGGLVSVRAYRRCGGAFQWFRRRRLLMSVIVSVAAQK
jgi:hypothetical protein